MTLIEYHMKKLISFLLALTIPALAACGSSKGAAEAAPTPIPLPTIDSQPAESAQPRWSPPAESAEAPAAVPETPVTTPETAEVPEEETQELPFIYAGVTGSEILDILGKPNRSEQGADSKHLYYDYDYNGIRFKTIEVDLTNDGKVWLIVMIVDETEVDREAVEAFTQKWADARQESLGIPAVFRSEDPLSVKYDWMNETLTLDKYPGGTEYHIGSFWKLAFS